ncbi:hypothetical protein, partial [Microbispora siamensis]|uniref:hypothetical protein n=1 Tax=Microbispora siamensis TaxID=564413 RepID=UPI00194E85EE
MGKIGPARWLLRVTTLVIVALLPGTLQIPAFPVAESVPLVTLNLPNVTAGSTGAPPVQQAGSAQELPHLVDTSATEPRNPAVPGPRPSDDGRRPEGGLPLEKRHTSTDEPAEGGLKSPPPLPAEIMDAKPEKLTGPPEVARAQGLSLRNVGRAKGASTSSALGIRKGSTGRTVGFTSLTSATAGDAVPAVSSLSALGTQSTGVWTLSSLTPYFQAKITDPLYRSSYLGYEVEHDPSVPAQGSGLISSGTGTTSASSGSSTSVRVPSGKLTDGWLVRWRVRGVTTTGVEGPWSEWQSARIDVSKPAVSELSARGTQGADGWTLSSLTPYFRAKITDPVFRNSYLGAEVEHDPSVPAQGSGLIWSGTGTTATNPDSPYASVSVPSGKLTDGWLVRWRVRGVTTTGVNGPWSDWQTSKVDITKPVVSAVSATPATQSAGLWTLASLQPTFRATITNDLMLQGSTIQGSYLGAEVEHDPSVPEQGSGLIWSGTGTTATNINASTASVSVPSGKLTDGWLVRWRVRGVYANGVTGPWSDWQTSKVDITK